MIEILNLKARKFTRVSQKILCFLSYSSCKIFYCKTATVYVLQKQRRYNSATLKVPLPLFDVKSRSAAAYRYLIEKTAALSLLLLKTQRRKLVQLLNSSAVPISTITTNWWRLFNQLLINIMKQSKSCKAALVAIVWFFKKTL